MEIKLKKYVSALIVMIMFSGSALAEETRQQCIDRVGNLCTAQHGNDSKGFNPDYYDCLEENMKLCPGFGE